MAFRVLFITPDLENNSLGRTYCLWLLAKEVGWTVRVISTAGRSIWAPLVDSEFSRDCQPVANLSTAAGRRFVDEQVTWADVVIAVKPLPESFGVALDATSRIPRPLLLDIDDPDIEYRLHWSPFRERVKDILVSQRRRKLSAMRVLATHAETIVSNPVLYDWYGGRIIPHVREAQQRPDDASFDSGHELIVRFIGSPRPHKGLEVLRDAVSNMRDANFRLRLEVTAEPPQDAKTWEGWNGETSFEEGQRLVASADVIVIPSLQQSWSIAQLPAKLIDAMMHGRPIIASDTVPIRWALGDAGLLVPPGDAVALQDALRVLMDSSRRRLLGLAAHARANEMFSVTSVASDFEAAVAALMA
jgi:glycosyltransferase involved in cell wall biosynthesis